MPRDGATLFSDLIGKLDDKCGRAGCYRLNRLIENHGSDGRIVDFLHEVAADCPRRMTVN